MKHITSILALMLLTMTPSIGYGFRWDGWVYSINGSDVATAANTAATATNTFNTNLLLSYIYGGMTPPVTGVLAGPASLGQLSQQQSAIYWQQRAIQDSLVQRARFGAINPMERIAQAKLLMGGKDIASGFSGMLSDAWYGATTDLMNTFSKEALTKAVTNLVTDISQCNTPQFDALFPNFNIDLGFAICDYGKMFKDVKQQTKTLVDRGWGGSFKVNGKDIDELMKDPSSLEDAIVTVSPGQGHALVADFLSKQSTDISLQSKVDTTALGEQINSYIDNSKKPLLQDRTIVDALNDSATVQAMVVKADLINADTERTMHANQIQMQANEIRRQEQIRAQEAHARSQQMMIHYMNGGM